MSKTISIVDVGIGNIASVVNAFSHLGALPKVISSAEDIHQAENLILPGVGSFSHFMVRLNSLNLISPIINHSKIHQKKLLGICLGFQVLGLSSCEDGISDGLGLIPAHVTRMLPAAEYATKIPHVGFNTARPSSSSMLLLPHLKPKDFYFVHSFHYSASQISQLPNNSFYALSHHGFDFISAYECENIFGVQFHPEKSQSNGLDLLSNFLSA